MYDGIDRIPIERLDDKQLRERVQILQDRYDVLLRRMPWISSGSSFELDWANIVTPLINALTNKIVLKARQKSDEVIETSAPPKELPYADKTAIYDYGGRYWYWDGLDWIGVNNRQTITSALTQTPTSFEFESMFYNVFSSLVRFIATQTYIRGDEQTTPPPYDDVNRIYKYKGKYWYWNGNEWKGSERETISSSFIQKPYGFSMDGVLEVLTELGSRLTISDSYLRMFPENASYPKFQAGYDADDPNSIPVVIFGAGSSEDTVKIKGYDVRPAQAVILKDEESLTLSMVSDWGHASTIELSAADGNMTRVTIILEGVHSDVYFKMKNADNSTYTETSIRELLDRIKKLEGTLAVKGDLSYDG